MEVPDQSRHELDVADVSIKCILPLPIHLSRRRNLLVSPLLRLPTELIQKIFVHVIELDDDKGEDYKDEDDEDYEDEDDEDYGDEDDEDYGDKDDEDNDNEGGSDDSDNDGGGHNDHRPSSLILTAICHKLRETGIAFPQLWDTVDLTTPLIAELFLERCKYDPHTLLKFPSASESLLVFPDNNPRRDALWEKLQSRTFNRLRSIVFEGSQHEFALMVVGILQKAPNVSNLDLCNYWSPPGQELPWPVGDPIPNLSTLHLSGFSICWTSPLLRNLTQLVLDYLPTTNPPERTPTELFLTALANCPHLETLGLTHTGPDLPNDHQDNCDTVVQLRTLREFSLEFRDPSRVAHILSHVGYPESTKLAVYVPVDINADMPEAISRVLPHRNAQTIQQFRNSTALTINLGPDPHFSLDNLLICFREPGFNFWSRRNPQVLTRFASKIVQVVGGDTIASLNVEAREHGPLDGMWEVLLHGLPQLERIYYHHIGKGEGEPLVNPFASVFSRLFEGSPVCPRLRHLELSKEILTHWGASVTALKRALTERDACGRRLKRMGLIDAMTEAEDRQVLEQFRDLVDEVEYVSRKPPWPTTSINELPCIEARDFLSVQRFDGHSST